MKKKRIIAAICAVLVVSGVTAGAFAIRSHAGNQPAGTTQNTSQLRASASDSDTISAGGTIACTQTGDTLGLVNTSVRLTVESVLVESGDTVTAGTPLFQVTADSLEKVEKTLRSELESAENDLIQTKISCQADQNEADILYESNKQLGSSAQAAYNTNMSELENSLNEAYSSYINALNTVGNTPSEISAKESELAAQQAEEAYQQEVKSNAQQAANEAQQAYSSAAAAYNSTAAAYNAAAGVVRYLGGKLGEDVSGIVLADTVSAEITQGTQDNTPSFGGGGFSDGGGGDPPPDMDDFPENFPIGSEYISENDNPVSDADGQQPDALQEALRALYDEAITEYEDSRAQLTEAQTVYREAETAYRETQNALTAANNALKEIQSRESSLEKEISSLNSTLTKAKSNLSKLRSAYNELKASYETDQLELQHTLETDTTAYENAEYHYQITSASIAETLAEAQEAYDTAAENVRIFDENLADGYIRAKQDGIVYALNGQAGRSISVSGVYVSYVDEESYYTTVELTQTEVTKVAIGDSVIIYSSESGMVNGKITAIAAGESTSLANVKFDITIEAETGTNLYNGESVNVYFNADNTQNFSNFRGGRSESGGDSGAGERSGRPDFGGEMPDFSGGMPEGFDPSNMPGFGR